MELCKKVQADEYVIHVVESTSFYTHLQFFLLASSWFPRPLGVCLWSALHMFLVLYEALMLLVIVPTIFVLAVLWDANLFANFVVFISFMVVYHFLGLGIYRLWLVITCRRCCTMPQRAPGRLQFLGQCIFPAAHATVPDRRQDPQPAPVVEGGTAAADESLCAILSVTRRFVNHVILVSYPYRKRN